MRLKKKENERDYAWTGKIITDRRSTTWTFPFHSFITWRDTWSSLNKSSQEKREKSECPFAIADDSVDDGSITFHPLWQKSWSGNRWRQKWERGQLDRHDLNHRRRVFRLEPSKGNGPRDACQVPKVKVKDPCGTRRRRPEIFKWKKTFRRLLDNFLISERRRAPLNETLYQDNRRDSKNIFRTMKQKSRW